MCPTVAEPPDIHIEPTHERDRSPFGSGSTGALHSHIQGVPAVFRNMLISRSRVMAGLDIEERRKPQDGKIRFRLGPKRIELRVATLPYR